MGNDKTNSTIHRVASVIAVIVITILAVGSSPSYQECEADASKQYSTEQKKEISSQFSPTVVWTCAGHFIDKNDPVITALATLVIAIFTIVLTIVTNRQAKLTKEALIADKRAFLFAVSFQHFWELDNSTGRRPSFTLRLAS